MFIQKAIITFICVGLSFVQAQEKHDILVSSAAVQILYRNCGNFVNINVPDLCSDFNPVCTATDAEIQKSSEHKRKFLIVPRGSKSIIKVSNQVGEDTTLLGSIEFKVIDPPSPSLEILMNGQRFSSSTSAGKGSKLLIKLIPDPEFAVAMNQDARYGIESIQFFTQFGLNSPIMVGEIHTDAYNVVEGINIPIPNEAFLCPRGSKIYIEIKGRHRINYKGQKVDDRICTRYENSFSFLSR